MRCVGGRDAHGACREAHNEGGWEPVRVFFGGRCRRCGARARFTHAAVCAATAVIGAALYGLLNDQATVSPAPEYFVVIKHREFASLLSVAGLSDAPLRVQAALVGLMGSWWFGVVAGIPLSVAATIGPSAPATMRAFLKAAGVVMACAACASVRCYAGAFVAQPHLAMEHYEWLALWDVRDVRATFAVGWWHSGAYAGGLVGTLIAAYLLLAGCTTAPPGQRAGD